MEFRTSSDLKNTDPSAKGLLLETDEGVLSQHHSIMRTIAISSSGDFLVGGSAIDMALNDQWMEFCWQELGKRMR